MSVTNSHPSSPAAFDGPFPPATDTWDSPARSTVPATDTWDSPTQSTVPATPARPPVVDMRIVGPLDADAVLRLREDLVPSLADGPVVVLVEISDVTRAAASGIAGLLELRRMVCVRGGDLRLYGASPAVGRARAAAQLDSITRIYPTRDDALHGTVFSSAEARTTRRFRRFRGFRG